MQDQQVMRVLEKFLRSRAGKFVLYLYYVFAGRQPGAVRNPKNMGVHGDGGLPECRIQNDIGGLAADTGQGFQCGPLRGYFAVVVIEQVLAKPHDMTGLAVEKDQSC